MITRPDYSGMAVKGTIKGLGVTRDNIIPFMCDVIFRKLLR